MIYNIKPLPDGIRKYMLEDRCISEDVLEALSIGWIESTKTGGYPWITIPILDSEGKTVWVKRRRPPNSKAKSKNLNEKGSKAALYALPYLHKGTDRIVICEGELDVLALLSLGIESVCSTAGAGHFDSEWLEYFKKNMTVILLFDNDDPGRDGKKKVACIFQNKRPDINLLEINLPKDLGKGGDVTDYLLRCRSNGVDPVSALSALEEPFYETVDSEESVFTVAKVPLPKSPVPYDEWVRTVKGNFPEFAVVAEACLSTVTQLLIKDITNCFALVIVDVPSSGKTITINFFDEIAMLSYSSDVFTPASFVSNSAAVKKEDLPNIDLLPRIRRKTLLIRDMATIFSQRDDDLMKSLGILTRVLDGEGLSTDTGVHGRRALRGDYVFMILAASTPPALRVWKAMGTLGQRLFFLGLHSPSKSEETLVKQLRGTSYKEKEHKCRHVTSEFLRTLWNKYPDGVDWNRDADDDECLRIITRCARLLSRLRGQVIVYKEKWDGDSEEHSHTAPIIEKPDRINQCLYNLARGHALAMGRTRLEKNDMKIVLLVSWDTAPGHRAKVFQELLAKNGALRTNDVIELLGCSDTTARKELETLCILKVCNEVKDEGSISMQKCIRLKKDLSWFLSKECRELLVDNTAADTLGEGQSESDTV